MPEDPLLTFQSFSLCPAEQKVVVKGTKDKEEEEEEETRRGTSKVYRQRRKPSRNHGN